MNLHSLSDLAQQASPHKSSLDVVLVTTNIAAMIIGFMEVFNILVTGALLVATLILTVMRIKSWVIEVKEKKGDK